VYSSNTIPKNEPAKTSDEYSKIEYDVSSTSAVATSHRPWKERVVPGLGLDRLSPENLRNFMLL
jgi:hypothetical protein